MLNLLAPAKVNLVLEVLGKRPDGYHEISSIMQSVSICDSLSFESAKDLSLHCTMPELESDNLVLKAARLLQQATDYHEGAKINLDKRIPPGTGLGGGSSDAATTLVALNHLWKLDLSFSQLLELAAKLGSDVPFFLYQGTALATGRGEEVTPLPPSSLKFVMLLPNLPPLPEKTKTLYSQLAAANFTAGDFTRQALKMLFLEKTLDSSLIFNVFDRIAPEAFPGLSDYWQKFELATGSTVHVAGSGPTLFALVENEVSANEVRARLSGCLECQVVSSFSPGFHPGC